MAEFAGDHSLARRFQLDFTFRVFIVLLVFTRNPIFFDHGTFEFIPIMVYWASHERRHHVCPVYGSRNDARMPHCLRWGGMASLLGGLGDRFPQHDRDLPSKAPPLAAGIFTLTAPLLFFLVVALASSPLFSRCSEPRYAFLRC